MRYHTRLYGVRRFVHAFSKMRTSGTFIIHAQQVVRTLLASYKRCVDQRRNWIRIFQIGKRGRLLFENPAREVGQRGKHLPTQIPPKPIRGVIKVCDGLAIRRKLGVVCIHRPPFLFNHVVHRDHIRTVRQMKYRIAAIKRTKSNDDGANGVTWEFGIAPRAELKALQENKISRSRLVAQSLEALLPRPDDRLRQSELTHTLHCAAAVCVRQDSSVGRAAD